MEKIVIIGPPGAGKSTFARQLGAILSIEVFHLDRYFWQPEWQEKPRETRRQIMQELVEKDQWIIEGTYLDTSEIRLKASDTIIFLDMPGWLCFWRVLNRKIKYKYNRHMRLDLPEGCPEKLGLYYILKILGFPLVKRKGLYARLCEFENEKKDFYALRSKREVERFLQKLGQRQQEYVPENAHILNALGFGVG